jgi:type IV pilus assembly protein PilB
MSTHGFVGELLIRNGVIDAAGLARARQSQMANGGTLARALASLGLADESAVAAAIASALHLEYLDGDLPPVAADVAALLPAEFCRKTGAVPIGLEGGRLRLAVTDPMEYSVFQDVEFRTGKQAVGVVVTQTWIEKLVAQLYPEPQRGVSYDLLQRVDPAGEVESANDEEYQLVDPATLAEDTRLPPVVRLVNLILSDAARSGASDVHIEPHETFVQVRRRIDGLLHDGLTIPCHLRDATISRLKIISGMDIAERRKPQDGKSRLRFDGRRIDLRVSTLPTQFGEKVVIRLLNSGTGILPLEDIGLSVRNLQVLQSALSRPQGMILLTGPTGSGKTSTLYAALSAIKSPANNIVTLEDPVEIQLPGVSQVQINVKAGVTFANGLRSILRQDPNVILVGEIRDQETAEIALGAAQTGHLLFSTLHTNDAPATITRLFDLGIQPFLVASSLVAVVAQRLVRRPCPACVGPAPLLPETVDRVGGASRLPADGRWVAGAGCDQCGQSGLKGRIAIHEVLQVNDDMRDLISNRAPEHVIRQAARRSGMRTLLEDGVEKAARALTTLDEVLRVVTLDEPVASTDVAAIEEPTDRTLAAPSPLEPPPVRTAPAGSDPAAIGDRPRVLVVEDSPTVASVVRYFLELEGFDVLVADNGLAGRDMALDQRPDVIVSDVNMPGMGGLAMVRALRADARTSGARVLMLTSEDSVESETAGLAAGADDYILKPVEPRRLAARVKALLGRARGHSG